MSLEIQNKWKEYYDRTDRCWVPNCPNSRSYSTKHFFRLPTNPKYRESWTALAGRELAGSEDLQGEIYFCQDHFRPDAMELCVDKGLKLKKDAIPYDNMPQRFCRTCMRLISNGELFCVLSKSIPSVMPAGIKPDLLQCRPEPLYQILTFCIPDLNLQHDPPPLVCFKCYQNAWLYFSFKLTCNAVETGLRGNLTAPEYGKMVLCRTCPQTSGTSFFILAEETLMGTLLKKMFLNDYPSDVVPLKVCLKCWNTLYKLKNFYEQCVATDEKMQRHISMTDAGPSVSQVSPEIPVLLDQSKEALKQLREVRKPGHSGYGLKNDVAYPQFVQQNVSSVGTTTVTNLSAEPQDLLPNTSVIKFAGDFENGYKMQERDRDIVPVETQVSLQMHLPTLNVGEEQGNAEPTAGTSKRPEEGYARTPPHLNGHPVTVQNEANIWVPSFVSTKSTDGQENTSASLQHQEYKRGYTWVPPHLNTVPVPVQERASTWVPPIIQKNDDICTSPVASSNFGTSPDGLKSSGETGNEFKLLRNETDAGCNKRYLRRYTDDQKIALVRLMQKYGEPLKYRTTPDIEFKVWTKVVNEFHKICNRSYDSILRTWCAMKRKAEAAFTQVGPASYQDQLVINYVYSYPTDSIAESAVNIDGGDCEIIILDDEMSGDETNVVNGGQIARSDLESGETPSKIPATADRINLQSKLKMRIKRGRPKKVKDDLVLVQEKKKKKKSLKNINPSYCKKEERKVRSPRGIPANKWTSKDKLQLAKAVRKEYETCLKNSELASIKSPWKMILQRLINGTYKEHNFDRLYSLWSQMKRSATIYEKNGLDLVDEEVWETLQIHTAIQKSMTKNPTKDAQKPSTVQQDNKPQNISTSTTINSNSNPPREPNDTDNSNTNNDKGSCYKVPVTTPPSSTSKLNTKNSKHYKKLYHHWTESEKIEFFKLLKQEFNSMVKNREPIICPWSKIIQRIASRGYKNFDYDTLYRLWTNIRKNASLHESDRQMSMLDCKVLRLLRLANKFKGGQIRTETKDDQKASDVAANSETVSSEDVEVTANSETVPNQDKPKKSCSETHKVVATSETVSESGRVADSTDSCKIWPLKGKLDLVDVIRSYGSDIFKNSKIRRKDFWSQVVTDYKARGYKKSLKEVYSCWHNLQRSAKLAWAQQKEPSQVDKAIIDFMMEEIEKKARDKEDSSENAAEEEDSGISDRMSELSNDLDIEEEITAITVTENRTDDDKLDEDTIDVDPDDGNSNVELNYNYVSLQDIENDFKLSIIEGEVTETTVKTELEYVSLEDCGIKLPPEMNGEVIVIDDSDEE